MREKVMNTFATKLARASALISVIVVLVAIAGRWMISSSPIFQLAKQEIQKQHGHPPNNLTMPLLRQFSFSEGQVSGNADFYLCTKESDCYKVDASKKNGAWVISVRISE